MEVFCTCVCAGGLWEQRLLRVASPLGKPVSLAAACYPEMSASCHTPPLCKGMAYRVRVPLVYVCRASCTYMAYHMEGVPNSR